MSVKKLFFAITLLNIFISPTYAQFNQWAWMHGSSNPGSLGVYGTQGLANVANMPPARYEGGEWTDLQGNLWIFGGGTTGNKVFNDLWKYDPAAGTWTWMKGSSTLDPPANYGTQGISAATNTPGGREFAPMTWTDLAGNLWLFGGDGLDEFGARGGLNDLWRYNIVTNEWTWMHGTKLLGQPGVYGVQGVPAPGNMPGNRNETACTWTDNNGNLWLFGGVGLDGAATYGLLNDLWKYDVTTNMWTWMSGSNTVNQNGIYGIQGVPAPANIPGGRQVYSSWKDINGNLWLYAGAGRDFGSGLTGYLNDLWMYNIATNMWTWVDGSNALGQTRPYGTKCVTAAGNGPSHRFEARARWTDDCGNFYLFGGSIGSTFGFSNDLWRYNPVTNLWTWVSGDNVTYQNGVYGTIGVPAPANKPGSRMGSNGFRNADGFWTFGGLHLFAYMNDLWKFVPDKPTAAYTPDTTAGCVPLTVNFTNTSSPNCNEIKSYSWNFGDPASGTINVSTSANPSYTYTASGTYNVKLVVTNCMGSKDSVIQTITVHPLPVLSVSTNTTVCSGTNVALTASGATSYTWTPAAGLNATTGSLVTASPTIISTYSVIGITNNGCSDSDAVSINVIPLPLADAGNDTAICIGETVALTATGGTTFLWNTGNTSASIVLTPISTAVYSVTVSNGICSGQDNITVTVYSPPLINAGQNIVIAPGTSAMLSAAGATSCNWSPALGLSCVNCCNPVASPQRTTTYYVTVTDANGCTATDSIIVYVNDLFVPTAFSPNGDGQNDVLMLQGIGVDKLLFVIYDRWGEKVFETNDITIGWDGTYKGERMNTAVFVYELNAKMPDGREINQKGNISLIR